jgi:hypothetical protein
MQTHYSIVCLAEKKEEKETLLPFSTQSRQLKTAK